MAGPSIAAIHAICTLLKVPYLLAESCQEAITALQVEAGAQGVSDLVVALQRVGEENDRATVLSLSPEVCMHLTYCFCCCAARPGLEHHEVKIAV